MTLGELEVSRLPLRNRIFLLSRVILIFPRSQLEMSIAVIAMCLTRLCVVLYYIRSVEARDLYW